MVYIYIYFFFAYLSKNDEECIMLQLDRCENLETSYRLSISSLIFPGFQFFLFIIKILKNKKFNLTYLCRIKFKMKLEKNRYWKIRIDIYRIFSYR